MDRDGLPVIVECKQGSPTVANVKQLRHYLWRLAKETGQKARGILVHGGARKLRRDVLNAAKSKPRIEIVQYKLDVELTPSS
jgi:RecB family endonuclease NucS